MIKKKKIAVFVDGEFIPSFSGATNRFHYLSRALQKYTDTEIVVLLSDRGWSNPEDIRHEKFKTYLLHPTLFKDVKFLNGILIKEKIDIIQFANMELAIGVGLTLSANLGKHLIFESHYDDREFAKSVGANKFALNKIRKLQNSYGRFFDKVIALSSQDIQILSKNLKIKKSKITAIPSGINKFDFPKNCFSLEKKKIIFLGNNFFDVNLKAIKRIKEDIYSKLKNSGYTFSIIGDIQKEEKKKLEGLQFHIIGKQHSLLVSFKDSTIALAPVKEGSGIRIKILNYLNAGIPVITTTQGARGFPKKDLLIIEDDLKKYPELINNMIKNENYLSDLSKRSRKYVRQNMSWKTIAKQVSKEYDSILDRKVVSKDSVINGLSKLKLDEPAWVKEVIQKKRFNRNKAYTANNDFLIIPTPICKIASLDGMPCAGKTTFIHKFQKKHRNVICLPELYIKPTKRNKFLSGENGTKYYSNAEIVKKTHSYARLIEGDRVLMDRSFLSTLAYYYAKSKTYNTKDYHLVFSFFRKNIDSIIIPDIFILLIIDAKESTKRRKSLMKEDTEEVWTNKTFLKHLLHFYKSDLFKIFLKNRELLLLNSSDMSKAAVFRKVSKILKAFYG